MEFTIYSIGDSAYLAQVLNALAMICGTGSFKTLVAIGGVIGLLVMGVQCIMTGTRQFNIHQTLVGMMAYMIMFGPSCTVLIEDAYNGTVRPVANVPIGPAVAGSMISNIGYGITDLFEQAYNDDITLTRKNTVEAMKALGELRSIAADNSIIEAASASLGSDVNLQLSIDNYFRECTMTGITLGTTTASQIYNQGIDGLRFDSNVYGTQVWLPSHVGEFMTCTAAWQPLKTAIDTAFRDPRTIRSVNRLLGIQTANGAVSDNFDELDNVYDMLTGAGQSASNYVKTAVLERLYEQAAAGTYRDLNDLASAVMVSTAIEQRNTQWAAEQSMFLTTMRPLMAFFEAFLYAITPLMAMLMMMGAFGMQLIGKYFQLTVWLQLWFPVLSVTNLYITMGARSELSNFLTDPVTFYGINQANQALQTWVSTGGMLAAATPLISLFILTGSTYAFTTLTGRMSGGDHINEKIASPDTIQPGAALAMMATKTFNGARGAVTTGAETMIPKLNVAQNLNAAKSASRSQLESDTQNVSQALVNELSSGRSSTESTTILESLGESISASHSDLAQHIINTARSMGFDVKAGTQQAHQLVGAVTASAVANAGVGLDGGTNLDLGQTIRSSWDAMKKKIGLGSSDSQGTSGEQDSSARTINNPDATNTNTINNPVMGIVPNVQRQEEPKKAQGSSRKDAPNVSGQIGLEGRASGSHTVSDTSGTSNGTSTSSGVSTTLNLSKSEMASLVDTMSKSIQKSSTETFAETSGSSESSSLQKAVSHLASSAKAYQEISTLSESVGVSQSYDFVQFAHALNTDKDALMYQYNLEEATKHFSPTQREKLNELTNQYRDMYGVSDPKDARMAATLQYLQTDGGNEGRAMLGEIIAKKMGMHVANIDSPNNQGIDRVESSESLKNAQLKEPNKAWEAEQSRSQQIKKDIENGDKVVSAKNANDKNETEQRGLAYESKLKKEAQEKEVHKLVQGERNDNNYATRIEAFFGGGIQTVGQVQAGMNALGFTPAQISSFTEIKFRPDHQIGDEHHKTLLEDTRQLLGRPEKRDASGNMVYDNDTITVTKAIERDLRTAFENNNLAVLDNVLSFTQVSKGSHIQAFGAFSMTTNNSGSTGGNNVSSAGVNNSSSADVNISGPVSINKFKNDDYTSELGVKERAPLNSNHPGHTSDAAYRYAVVKANQGEDK